MYMIHTGVIHQIYAAVFTLNITINDYVRASGELEHNTEKECLGPINLTLNTSY